MTTDEREIKKSEKFYKNGKILVHQIQSLFYTIENEMSNANQGDKTSEIESGIEMAHNAIANLKKVDLEILASDYDRGIMKAVRSNVANWIKRSEYIEDALNSMKLYDELIPTMDDYLRKVDHTPIRKDFEDALQELARYITDKDRYDQYRNEIKRIIAGTMSVKQFENIIDILAERIPKENEAPRAKSRNNLPPEMWPNKEKNSWNQQLADRRKVGVDDETQEFDITKESFMSLENYKKLYESLAYTCGTCGERAEHEEIEDNPNMRCPNCGDCNWEQEY